MIIPIASIWYWGAQLRSNDRDTFHNPLIMTAMMLSIFIGMTLFHPLKKPIKSDDTTMLLLLGINILFLAFIFYIGSIYPNLPQEMGGAKPRCAQLDIIPEKLSPATLTNLIEIPNMATAKGGIRTRKLWILFSGGDRIIAILGDPLFNSLEHKNIHNKLIELKQSSVSAISWCE